VPTRGCCVVIRRSWRGCSVEPLRRKDILPHKRRLEALLKELDGQEVGQAEAGAWEESVLRV